MGWPLRACQGGSICFLHRNSVSSNRNTGLQEARNKLKKAQSATNSLGRMLKPIVNNSSYSYQLLYPSPANPVRAWEAVTATRGGSDSLQSRLARRHADLLQDRRIRGPS